MPELDPRFLTIPLAHRGLHARVEGRVENSRAACEAAIAAGYGIEIDLQCSRDAHAMVFHDDTLERLTAEAGAVSARSAEELGRIAFTDGGETIPTLREILALVAGRAPLLIEIKDQDGAMGSNTGALERAVAEDLRNYKGPVAVMSFNPHAVAAFQAHLPGVPVGLTTAAFDEADWGDLAPARRAELATLSDVTRLGAGFISHDRKSLDSPPVAALKTVGLPIFCWTIRSEAEEAEARRVADNITFEGYRPSH